MQGISGKEFVVFGLLNEHSIAYAIGECLVRHGARVVYTIQGEVLRRRYLDPGITAGRIRADLTVEVCDVTKEDEIAAVFKGRQGVGGIVHSVAYANPKTCLGASMHDAGVDDVNQSYDVSCVSLANVVKHAAPALGTEGSVVALTFDSRVAYPVYNWMGVHKAALEALVRALAREHGPRGLRVNAVSAGPLATTAAVKIPGFEAIQRIWEESCPLGWDMQQDQAAVADAVTFLLSDMARKITGQVMYVDGGASSSRGTVGE